MDHEKTHEDNNIGAASNKIIKPLVGNQQFLLPSRSILNDDEIAAEENRLKRGGLSLYQLFKDAKNSRKIRSTARSTRVSSPGMTKWDVSELENIVATPAVEDISSVLQQQPTGIDDDDWHIIPERSLTEEEKRDLRVIENRQHLDPKRFYKSMGTGRARGEIPSRVQFGTVVVGPHEFYSARVPRRQRRARIIDEVLADGDASRYIRNRGKRYAVAGLTNRRIVDPAAKRRKRRR